jgi:U3 small nucleolar RNA-associated protein MPP10
LGLNNPYEKRKLREELQQARVSGKVKTGEKDQSNDFKSSTSFFQKMQADIVEAKSGKEFKKSSKY